MAEIYATAKHFLTGRTIPVKLIGSNIYADNCPDNQPAVSGGLTLDHLHMGISPRDAMEWVVGVSNAYVYPNNEDDIPTYFAVKQRTGLTANNFHIWLYYTANVGAEGDSHATL